jgi:hypothetical protein
MKRIQILGLFIGIGALSFVGYEPAAKAMPISAAAVAAGFAVESSDGLVEMTATRGSARRTARRTSRRNP